MESGSACLKACGIKNFGPTYAMGPHQSDINIAFTGCLYKTTLLGKTVKQAGPFTLLSRCHQKTSE